MKLFDWLTSAFSSAKNVIATGHNAHQFGDDNQNRINPASSLPMSGSIDIHGNLFGTGGSVSHEPFVDHHHLHVNNNSSFNDYHNHHDTFHHLPSPSDYYDPFKNY